MLHKLVFAGLLAAVFCDITARTAAAMGTRSPLARKSPFPIPARTENATQTVECEMNKALSEHASQFVGGHNVNAHSVLHFAGGTRTVNLLLDDLSRIDGAVLRIQFSKERGITERPFADRAEQPKPCDVKVDHNAWGSAREVIMTIYLGSDGVKLEDIVLPAIQGRASPKQTGLDD